MKRKPKILLILEDGTNEPVVESFDFTSIDLAKQAMGLPTRYLNIMQERDKKEQENG